MDTTLQAKRIGYGQAFKAITVGLLSAYVIMTLMTANAAWLIEFEYLPILFFAAFAIYAVGFLFGQIAGVEIIIKHRPPILTGIKHGFFIVWTSTFIASLIGYFKEGLAATTPISYTFNDYILKPLLLVSVFGLIPIILVGLWFGYSIKTRAENLRKQGHYP